MPGNPFKKPFRGGNTRAKVKSPQKPKQNVSHVPRPTSPVGVRGRAVAAPRQMGVRVTTKARKNVKTPAVRQGAQMGTPGRTGSRPGASYE